MRHLLFIGAAIGFAGGLAGCADPAIRLANPRTGMVATCDANHAINMSQTANERCAQEFERQGYVRGGSPAAP